MLADEINSSADYSLKNDKSNNVFAWKFPSLNSVYIWFANGTEKKHGQPSLELLCNNAF